MKNEAKNYVGASKQTLRQVLELTRLQATFRNKSRICKSVIIFLIFLFPIEAIDFTICKSVVDFLKNSVY